MPGVKLATKKSRGEQKDDPGSRDGSTVMNLLNYTQHAKDFVTHQTHPGVRWVPKLPQQPSEMLMPVSENENNEHCVTNVLSQEQQ